jgi:5'-nucleotidase
VLKLSYSREQKKLTLKSYALDPITDAIPADPEIQADLDEDVTAINALLPSPLKFDATIAHTSFDLPKVTFGECGLGDLIADAYYNVDALLEGAPPDFAFEVGGNIRASLLKGKTGNLWFADVFRVEPLGVGPDQKPGYPLVSYYLTGADIKSGLEVSASAEDFLKDDSDFLQVSQNFTMSYRKDYPVFERVQGATINGETVDFNDNTTCYKVVSTIYVAELLGLVNTETHGLLNVIPKDADCSTPITDWTSHRIDADPVTDGIQEMKNWQALLGYLQSFPANGDGIPEVPAVYQNPQDRIVAE